jgi:hypothetical protein
MGSGDLANAVKAVPVLPVPEKRKNQSYAQHPGKDASPS